MSQNANSHQCVPLAIDLLAAQNPGLRKRCVGSISRTLAKFDRAIRRPDSSDDGTNDLIVSDVIRRNELQVWFVAEHIVDLPLVQAG